MKRTILMAAAAAGAAALGAVTYTELAGAGPAPPASVQVLEQNLDAMGLIRVHEQGTASVAVQNFPAVQRVNDTGDPAPTHFQHHSGGPSDWITEHPFPSGAALAITSVTAATLTSFPAVMQLQVGTVDPSATRSTCQQIADAFKFESLFFILAFLVEPTASEVVTFPDEPLVATSADRRWCLKAGASTGSAFITIVGHHVGG